MVEEISLDPDTETLREVIGKFVEVWHNQNMSVGMDYIIDVLRRSMPDYGISRKRPTEACCQCAEKLFCDSHEKELVICEVCDHWVHNGPETSPLQLTCYEEHMRGHIPGLLTRGLKRIKIGVERAKNLEEAHRLEKQAAEVKKAARRWGKHGPQVR